MCIIEKFDKVPLIWIELIVILISGTSHIILAFTRNMPEFNAYELFNSSPIFDLSLFDLSDYKQIFFIHGVVGKDMNLHQKIQGGNFMMKQI